MKKLLIAVGAVVVLLLGALVALLTLVDVDRFKPQIEQMASEHLQRRLAIDGKLTLALFPRIAVAIPHTTLSAHGSGETAASLDSARLSVALLPLLHGRIEANTIRIDGLQATILRNRDGSTSIDDLVHPAPAAGAATPAPGGAAAPGALPRFEIGGVELHGAHLTFDDRQAGSTYVVSGLELTTGRLANVTRAPVELAAHFSSTQPAAAGDLGVKGTLDLDLDRGAFGAAGLAATLKANLANPAQPAALDAQLDAARLALDRASGAISVEKLALAAHGNSGTTQLAHVHLAAPALAYDPVRKVLSIGGLDFAADGKLGADPFSATLSAPKIEASASAASGERIQATVKLSGSEALDARLLVEGLGGTLNEMTIGKLTLDAELHQPGRSVVVTLASPATASVENLALALTRLTADVAIDDAALPQKSVKLPLSGLVAVDARKQSADIKLSTRFDETNLDLRAETHGFAKPKIGFELDADRLNLDRYFPPAATGGKGPGNVAPAPAPAPTAPPARAAAGDPPIDLEPLKALDLSGQLRVGSLQVHGLKASQVRLDLNVAGGRLDLAPIAAQLYGGTLDASASANASGNRIAARAALANVALGPLLKDLLDRDLIEGRGNVDLNLDGAGATLGALERELEGTGSLALRDGALKGINIAQRLREAPALLGGKGASDSHDANAFEKTDFTTLAASFVVHKGVVANHDLDAKSPLLRLSGEGSADLPASTLDYTLRVSIVGTLKGQDGRDLSQLRGVTVPVRAVGPFAKLGFTLDWSELALQLAKSKAVDALKATAAPQLQNALKGLLGGKK